MLLPIHTDINTWANSLAIDFPSIGIPVFKSGDDWRKWGAELASLPFFQQNFCKAPSKEASDSFEDFQRWAQGVYYFLSIY